MKKLLLTIGILVFMLFGLYVYRFYPKQLIDPQTIVQLNIITPEPEKYHNDCLHPCIRYSEQGFAGYHYWMAQSPYYAWNNKVENPILYHANCLDSIGCEGGGITDTPSQGFNSDPNIFIDGDSVLYVFWRECYTPLCDSLGVSNATVGMSTRDGLTFTPKQVYLTNSSPFCDTEQAPTLIKHGDKYWFYAAWYEYEPIRHNKGIAIWQGKSLSEPDFLLTDTLPFNSTYTVDKAAQIKLNKHIFYFPQPHRFDLWHFDLIQLDEQLLLVASEEKNDVLMLAVSDDYRHFRTIQTPLINNHYMENHCHYRQYYYKPTAIMQQDTLLLFYTTNSDLDPAQNILLKCQLPIKGKL